MSIGCLLAAQENLRQTLATLGPFHAFCGVMTDEAAIERIYYDYFPRPANGSNAYTRDELVGYRPCAIIEAATENGFMLEADTHTTYRAAGRLILKLFDNVADEDLVDDLPVAEVIVNFREKVGAIIDALREPDQLMDVGFRAEKITTNGPWPSDPGVIATQGGWQQYDIELEWQGI